VKNEEAAQGVRGTEPPAGSRGGAPVGGLGAKPHRSWKAFKIHLPETIVFFLYRGLHAWQSNTEGFHVHLYLATGDRNSVCNL